jgi:hypothetical protein
MLPITSSTQHPCHTACPSIIALPVRFRVWYDRYQPYLFEYVMVEK